MELRLAPDPKPKRLTTEDLQGLVGENVRVAYTCADAREVWPDADIEGEDDAFYCWISGKVLALDRIQILFERERFASSYLAIEHSKDGELANRYRVELEG